MARRPTPVSPAEAKAQLERAAVEPLSLIECDRERAHWRSKPLFDKLSDPNVLFADQLTYTTLLESANIQGDRTTNIIQFHKETAQSLWEYVEARRLETAIHLLVGSDIPVGYIAGLVGFPSQNKLCSAMKRRYGVRPTDVRSRIALSSGYSLAGACGEAHGGAGDWCNDIATMAKELWGDLQTLPYDRQDALIRAVRFHTPHLIDLLGKEYLIASRADRHRGVEVAKLALVAVDTSAELLGDAAQDLRALVYAWMGNAARLALDYVAAEDALSEAEEAWDKPRARPDLGVAAAILAHKATLRFSQRQFDQSVDLLNQAIEQSRLAGAFLLLAQSLLLRAGVFEYAGMGKPTLPDLKLALRILQNLNEPRLTLGTHMILAYSYSAAGLHHDALKQVADAWCVWEGLSPVQRDPLLPAQLRWNEGLARHGLGELATAEGLYEESRAAFIALEEPEHGAIVALDLARLCREQGRASEVLRLASEALPVLEALMIPEATEALDLLRDGLENSAVSTVALDTVRTTLVRIDRMKMALLA